MCLDKINSPIHHGLTSFATNFSNTIITSLTIKKDRKNFSIQKNVDAKILIIFR